jgi:hypothetical protein
LLFGLEFAALASQPDDLEPPLIEAAVGQRFGRALLAFAWTV